MISMEKRKGAILIITLWILSILTLFAIGLGYRMSLELKVVGYYRDSLKSFYIAKAGIQRAIAEKEREYKKGMGLEIDALSEPWANDEEVFKKAQVGDGTFTVSYRLRENDFDEDFSVLYGMMDERSKININKVSLEILRNLLRLCGAEEEEAKSIAACIIDWRDTNGDPVLDGVLGLIGAEDLYYQSLEMPYHCKNADFDCAEELLLVKGVTPELFYGEDRDEDGILSAQEEGIKNYVTVYGDGSINVNTARLMVLKAFFGDDFPELANKILTYRKGMDEKSGTIDDRWFTIGSSIIDRGDAGFVEVKDIGADWIPDPLLGVSKEEWDRMKELSVQSNIFGIDVVAEIRKATTHIQTVVAFDEQGKPTHLYWHED